MTRAGARRAAAVLLAMTAACRGAGPRVPSGVIVIREEAPPPPALVEEAQRQLQRRGWYVGMVDGAMSPATRVALAKLQREEGLEVTGRLDAPTLDALGLGWAPGAPEGERPEPTPAPAPPLRPSAGPEHPQPPPGALDAAREEARKLLAEGISAAAPLPSGSELAAGPLAPPFARMGDAAHALASFRTLAFERMARARDEGGWAPLPPSLLSQLEDALARRSLLVHGPDGRLGDDDEAAIRWVELSVGLPATGRPSLPLLEALGIDPSPMFEP